MTPINLLSSIVKATSPKSTISSDDDDYDDTGWVHGGKYVPPTTPQTLTVVATHEPSQVTTLTTTTPSTTTNNQPVVKEESSSLQTFLLNSGVTPYTSLIINTTLSTIWYYITLFISCLTNTVTTAVPVPDTIQHSKYIQTLISLYNVISYIILQYMLPIGIWIIQTTISLVLSIIGTLLVGLMVLVVKAKAEWNTTNSTDKSGSIRNGSKRSHNNGSCNNTNTMSIVKNVQSSAIKSLKENVVNSPFLKLQQRGVGSEDKGRRRLLPFMGFQLPSPQETEQQRGTEQQGVSVNDRRRSNGILASSLAGTSSSSSAVSSTNSKPTSAIRTNSLLKKRQQHVTPYNNSNLTTTTTTNQTKTTTPLSTQTPRRVLFSENADTGEVTTQQFMFDKHLPPSARKDKLQLQHGNDSSGGSASNSSTHYKEEVKDDKLAYLHQIENQFYSKQMKSNPNTKPKLILPNGWIILWSKTQKQWWFYHQTLGKCWDLGSLVERCLNDVVEEGHLKSTTPPVSGKRGNASASLGSGGGTVSTNKSINEKDSNPLAVSSSNEESQGLKSQDEAKTTSFNTEKKEIAATVQQQQQQNEEEMQKQIYIEKYGLLPSITPLSKRYGRMKRQQKQQEQKGDEQQNLPSTEEDNTASANNDNTIKSAVDPTNIRKKNTSVAKRKRRGDLLGAASRIRRSRLNNNTTATTASFHTTTLRNPKRRREEEEEKADDWVWKAMNRTDEKENRDNDDGDNEGAYSVKKRGKFTNSSSSTTTESSNVDTPPHKHSSKTTTLPPISLTPPKTPGPSKATFGSATPAPKKLGHDTTDTNTLDDGEKPSIPFSFGKDDDSAAKKETTQQPAATATPGTPGFSFGSSAPASSTTDKKDTPKPSFSFGSTPVPQTEKKDEAPKPAFAFGSNTPATTDTKKDDAPKPGLTFGSTPAQNTAVASDSSSATPAAAQKPFSFGSAPAQATITETKNDAPKVGFSFGSTPAAVAAPTDNSAKTPSSTFAFGSTNTAGASFGSTAAKTAPTFAFGANNDNPSASLSGGGASSRRRAAAKTGKGRRKG